MITGQLQIEIEAKPEIVFDLLADFTKFPTWNPRVTEVSLIPEEPIEKGSTGKITFKSGRRRMEYEFICHECDRPKAFSLELTAGDEISEINYEFTPTEKGTRINFRFEFQPRGFLRLLEPFFKPFKWLIIGQERKEFEALKDYINRNKQPLYKQGS